MYTTTPPRLLRNGFSTVLFLAADVDAIGCVLGIRCCISEEGKSSRAYSSTSSIDRSADRSYSPDNFSFRILIVVLASSGDWRKSRGEREHRTTRSISRTFEDMFLLVFLLGSAALASITENGTSDLGIFINPDNKMLLVDCSSSIKLDLSGLGARVLDRMSFKNCTSVRTLDLSSNWINELSPGIFSGMTNLEHLSLAYNKLNSKTMIGAFRGLSKLKSLDITHNPLSAALDHENFVGLPKSCEIHIGRSQKLRTITPRAFGKRKKLDPKNRTVVNESKNCPDRLDDRIEMFEVERSWIYFTKEYEYRHQLNDEPYSDDGVKMCTDSTTVRFVEFSNVTDTLQPNCRTILINAKRTKLKIYDDTITSFDSGWLRIRNTSVNAIYLYPKTFENLTSDLLNDLPENIRFFSLQKSDLERLNRGVMANEHLRGLDLSGNFIRFIEDDAFAGLKLTRLNLGYNPLVTLDYVSTLPETLLWLNLEETSIVEIPGNTFSRLKNLLAVTLSGNSIEELQPPSLDGLVSLQSLDLAIGHMKNLRPGVFRNLSALHYLDLSVNDIERLDRGVFNGLGCLAKLDLRWNHLTRFGGAALAGLTDSLEVLDLRSNKLEILEADSFVGVPKYNLSLEENDIRKIEKDAFDLPYLRYLDLRRNNLTTIEKGAAKSLGSLADKTEIRLGFNPIERLDNGALAGLSSQARVNFVMTPINVIQMGVFDDS